MCFVCNTQNELFQRNSDMLFNIFDTLIYFPFFNDSNREELINQIAELLLIMAKCLAMETKEGVTKEEVLSDFVSILNDRIALREEVITEIKETVNKGEMNEIKFLELQQRIHKGKPSNPFSGMDTIEFGGKH